jgi:hypothetical protein
VKPRRTPGETWEALEGQWVDDEMQRVLAMTPSARRSELRATGVDVDAMVERLDGVRRPFQVAERDSADWRPAPPAHALGWIALTLLAALGAATTVGLLARHVVGPHGGRAFETASPP